RRIRHASRPEQGRERLQEAPNKEYEITWRAHRLFLDEISSLAVPVGIPSRRSPHAASHKIGRAISYLANPDPNWRNHSASSIAAAADTFRLSTAPVPAIESWKSQDAARSAVIPSPSAPRT